MVMCIWAKCVLVFAMDGVSLGVDWFHGTLTAPSTSTVMCAWQQKAWQLLKSGACEQLALLRCGGG